MICDAEGNLVAGDRRHLVAGPDHLGQHLVAALDPFVAAAHDWEAHRVVADPGLGAFFADDRDAALVEIVGRGLTGQRRPVVDEGDGVVLFDGPLGQGLVAGGIAAGVVDDELDGVAVEAALGVGGGHPGLDRLGPGGEDRAQQAGVLADGTDHDGRLDPAARPGRGGSGLTAARDSTAGTRAGRRARRPGLRAATGWGRGRSLRGGVLPARRGRAGGTGRRPTGIARPGRR